MNVLAISSLLATLVILAIGASVLLRDRTRRTYTSFAAFTFMVSAWHLCNFIAMVTGEPMVEWLALWPAATIPPVALQFFREFMAEPAIGGKRRPPRITLAWTFVAYMALIYSALVRPIHEQPGSSSRSASMSSAALYRCVFELYVQYRRTTGARRQDPHPLPATVGGLSPSPWRSPRLVPHFGVGRADDRQRPHHPVPLLSLADPVPLPACSTSTNSSAR